MNTFETVKGTNLKKKTHDLNRTLRQKNTKLEQYLKLHRVLIFLEH